MVVDAVVSRQFANAIAALQSYKDQGLLPSTIVVHLGTNGRFGDGEFDTMMADRSVPSGRPTSSRRGCRARGRPM